MKKEQAADIENELGNDNDRGLSQGVKLT